MRRRHMSRTWMGLLEGMGVGDECVGLVRRLVSGMGVGDWCWGIGVEI